jgi:Fe-S cluster biosynthesis and repair protein YggX
MGIFTGEVDAFSGESSPCLSRLQYTAQKQSNSYEAMSNTVYCVVLKREAPALDRAPYPGELGERILENVSSEGWRQWLDRLTIIMNEMRLSTADPQSLEVIEQHMVGFLFGEGEMGQMPSGFTPQGSKK